MADKLPKTQAELLEAMRAGVTCTYMRAMGSYRPNAYYFRGDNGQHCTAPARALLAKGLAEKFNVSWAGDHELRIKPGA